MNRLYLYVLLIAAAGLLVGCGSGSNTSPAGAGSNLAASGIGRATFIVNWPPRSSSSRLIPVASNSIDVSIVLQSDQYTSIAHQVLARPATGNQTSATFDTLPATSLKVIATAYPNADGTGNAQAQASAPLAVQANQNTTITLTMASTISSILITPSDLIALTVAHGATVQLTATPNGSSGIVLTSPSTIQWTSANRTIATVDASGKVQGVAAGTTQITVTETESGKSAAVTVTVL